MKHPKKAANPLIAEVRAMLAEMLAESTLVAKEMLIGRVIESHRAISGEDASWYRASAWHGVEKIALALIRGMDRKASDLTDDDESLDEDRQLAFPGHVPAWAKRLQPVVPIERDGSIVFAQLQELTPEECRAKQAMHYAHSDGHSEKGDEYGRLAAERETAPQPDNSPRA